MAEMKNTVCPLLGMMGQCEDGECSHSIDWIKSIYEATVFSRFIKDGVEMEANIRVTPSRTDKRGEVYCFADEAEWDRVKKEAIEDAIAV